jgi:Phospholipase_D-nuclease N-terminal
MLRYLPIILVVVLDIYCLVDIVVSRPEPARSLPRALWALLVLVPFAGAAGWLWLGRPDGTQPAQVVRRGRTFVAPDDDVEFLRRLPGRPADRDLFESWEQELGDTDPDGGSDDGQTPA